MRCGSVPAAHTYARATQLDRLLVPVRSVVKLPSHQRHSSSEALPACGAKRPTGHGSQGMERPVELEYVPGSHGVGMVDDGGQYVPAGHMPPVGSPKGE